MTICLIVTHSLLFENKMWLLSERKSLVLTRTSNKLLSFLFSFHQLYLVNARLNNTFDGQMWYFLFMIILVSWHQSIIEYGGKMNISWEANYSEFENKTWSYFFLSINYICILGSISSREKCLLKIPLTLARTLT